MCHYKDLTLNISTLPEISGQRLIAMSSDAGMTSGKMTDT
jgi:hypothetical protein